MSKKPVDRPYNGGRWTETQMREFIIGVLRKSSVKWGPIGRAIQAAKVGYGKYLCNACKKIMPATIPAVRKSGKDKGKLYRQNNKPVDHVEPIVPLNGEWGETTRYLGINWNEYLPRQFCEKDNLQVLDHACHAKKTAEEAAIRAEFKRQKKGIDSN